MDDRILMLAKEEKLLLFKLAVQATDNAMGNAYNNFNFGILFNDRINVIANAYFQFKYDSKLEPR